MACLLEFFHLPLQIIYMFQEQGQRLKFRGNVSKIILSCSRFNVVNNFYTFLFYLGQKGITAASLKQVPVNSAYTNT